MKIIEKVMKICEECIKLKDVYVSEKELRIDWVCIFSQNEVEYQDFLDEATKIGEAIETTESGIIFKLTKNIQTSAGSPKLLKVRKFDNLKPELGDVDFTTNYPEFKKTYLNNKNFKLITRDRFEMIELSDSNYNVRCYFSSIPPSKLRGVN